MQQVNFRTEETDIVLFTHDAPDHLYNVYFHQKNFYELDLLHKVRSLHQPGRIIIDAGANIGNHTVYFAKMMQTQVIAFEPFPLSLTLLLQNIAANGCADLVTVHGCALGAQAGSARATISDYANFGMVSVRPAPDGKLTMARLDDVIPQDSDVGIIKIDVEGGEMGVLQGAAEILKRCKPHIFAEAAETSQRDEIAAFLGNFGYAVQGRYCVTATYHFSPAEPL